MTVTVGKTVASVAEGQGYTTDIAPYRAQDNLTVKNCDPVKEAVLTELAHPKVTQTFLLVLCLCVPICVVDICAEARG